MIQTIKQWLYAKKARRLKRAEVETDADAHNREVVSYAARALKAEKEADELRRKFLSARSEQIKLMARLSRISALETPRCAHIGRKMARIARGEG